MFNSCIDYSPASKKMHILYSNWVDLISVHALSASTQCTKLYVSVPKMPDYCTGEYTLIRGLSPCILSHLDYIWSRLRRYTRAAHSICRGNCCCLPCVLILCKDIYGGRIAVTHICTWMQYVSM